MNQRLSLGVLTTGLGAAALIGFSAGPALADHTDSRPAVVRQQPPPDPQKLAALLPKLQELSANPKVKLLTAELESVPAVADLKKARPGELGDKLEVAISDPKVGVILAKLERIPAVKAFLIAGFSGLTTATQSGAVAPAMPGASTPASPAAPAGVAAPVYAASAAAQVNAAAPANAVNAAAPANAANAAAPANAANAAAPANAAVSAAVGQQR
jgi:hypothetical protein